MPAANCGAELITYCRSCWTDQIPWWFPENRKAWYWHCCNVICQAEYMACVALNGIESACAAVLDFGAACADWIANNPGVVVGTLVVIAGVALIVTLGPGGAVVLVAI